MNDDNQKTRSPNSPKISLQEALTHTESLYKKAGRSSLQAVAAANALGYKGLTGSSLTLLAALNQYGLVDRDKGEVKISPLALRILHPVGPDDRASAIRQSALTPVVYSAIHENHNDLSEDVLSNQLIHKGFAPDIAKRVASAYRSNYEFANLGDAVSKPIDPKPSVAKNEPELFPPNNILVRTATNAAVLPAAGVLATFTVPLGLCEAQLTFTGSKLDPEDFDALAEYVSLFKKQYVRKVAAATVVETTKAKDETSAVVLKPKTNENEDWNT